MAVLVYTEHVEGEFKKSAFEAVSYAKELARETNTQLFAICLGDITDETSKQLGTYGADKVIIARSPTLNTFSSSAYASVISEAANKEGANIIVLSNSFSGKGLAPAISVKLNAGIVAGAIDLPKIEGGKFIVKRLAFSGKAYAWVELLSDKKVISLNPNAYPIVESPGAGAVEHFETALGPETKISLKEVIRSTDKISLPEAEIVVSGGRGLKGPENWSILEDLAAVLGAATACSKPVSDAGWRPHEEHVGQTGIVISPNLYLAIGISGAIQHLAGVSSSKTIVAINKDPEAPIFKVANYGIVGDALEIVPKLTQAIKTFKG